MRPHFAITLSVAVVLAACAGSLGGGPTSPYRGTSSSSAASSPTSAASAYTPGSEVASAAGSAGDHDPSPDPGNRPGLGTVWGETVRSRVRSTPFTRASQSPFAAVAIHYNDEEGALAQAQYLGDHQPTPWYAHTPHGGISVALVDGDGQPLPGGEVAGRNLVVGRDGERYNIVVINHTPGRYEIVASVDGLDVIDGQPADPAKRGYILEPHATVTIDGFRRSDDAVAAFRFGRVADSYAALTSGDRNVGVIGVAMFAERGSRWTSDELYRRDTADPFPGDPSYARPPASSPW